MGDCGSLGVFGFMYFFLFFFALCLVLEGLIVLRVFFGSFSVRLFFFSIGGVDLSFRFLFDYVSLGFFGAVSFISRMVFFYSVFYIEGTVDMRRFV